MLHTSSRAAAYVERRYGDVYVDSKHSKGFGINGCIIDRVVVNHGKLASLELKKGILKLEEMKVTVR